MASQKVRQLSTKARKLAKELDVPPPAPRPARPFRPITGNSATWPLPKITKARINKRRRRGRPRAEEPMEAFIMKMPRREKRRWQRAARDLGIPLGGMVRIAMRYFMGSRRMRKLIALGPREIEFKKRVGLPKLAARMNSVIAPDDYDTRESHPSELAPRPERTPATAFLVSPPAAEPGRPRRRLIVPP